MQERPIRLVTKLFPADGLQGGSFGYSTDICAHGRFIVVGAPNSSPFNLHHGGSVYLYEKVDEDHLEERARLYSYQGKDFDHFGVDVAVSDQAKVVVVGKYSENQPGIVGLFRRHGDVWVKTMRFVSPRNKLSDQYGRRVTVSNDGDTLAIAAPGRQTVFIFRHIEFEHWELEAELSLPSQGCDYGKALKLSGNGEFLLVGAPGSPGIPGRVFLYQCVEGRRWREVTCRFSPNRNSNDDRFGSCVDIDCYGTSLAVGAPNSSIDALSSGRVYVYDVHGNVVVPMADLKPNTAFMQQRYGRSLALSGDGMNLMIGSQSISASLPETGAVHVYRRNGMDWYPEQYKQRDNATSGDGFASDLSTDHTGQHVLVGARYDDHNGFQSGAAFLFQQRY